MEPHGGYLCRLEGVETDVLVGLARKALLDEGRGAAEAALLVCLHPERQWARLAFDAPFTYGRIGAQWYKTHVALAQRLSRSLAFPVHAYVFDPQEEEWCQTFSKGLGVESTLLRYVEAELSEEDVDDELDEQAFERLKEKWPLGQLARKLSFSRKELLSMPRGQTVWLPLEGTFSQGPLLQMFEVGARRPTREFRLNSA